MELKTKLNKKDIKNMLVFVQYLRMEYDVIQLHISMRFFFD